MKIKQIAEDFIVNEIVDFNKFEEKDENRGDYYYFYLTKKNYSQIKALEPIARIFKVSRKMIHFAGTKDKIGITKQVISIWGVKKTNLEVNTNYFNEKIKDIHLNFIGTYKGRINLSDNLGNKFNIVIRDLNSKTFDLNLLKNNIEKVKIEGVWNYFDTQRFGFDNNTDLIGKYVLQNNIEKAVYTILTSTPKDCSEELKIFVSKISENWEKIKNWDDLHLFEELINLIPKEFPEYKLILEHLKKYKNDFPGSFRTLHKKIRTLYFNAYQSRIFNLQLDYIKNKLLTNEKSILKNIQELELINENYQFLNNELDDLTKNILQNDHITSDNFKFTHMPELKNKNIIFRKIKIFPKNIELGKLEKDDLNENKYKIKICFELNSGCYATNVIKQLFNF